MFESDNVKNLRQKNGLYIGERVADSAIVVGAHNVSDFVSGVVKNFPAVSRSYSGSCDYDYSFNHFRTFEEATKTFITDPNSLVQKTNLGDLSIPSVPHMEVEYDVTGDFFDVGMLLDGVPEHWGSIPYTRPSNIYASIVFNISTSWRVKPIIKQLYSMYIVSLCDWLESYDIRVRVTGRYETNCATAEVNVKNYDEPSDLAMLAVVSNTDFLRRVIFRVIEHSNTYNPYYGMYQPINKHTENDISIIINTPSSSTLDSTHSYFKTIIEQLKDNLATNARAFNLGG